MPNTSKTSDTLGSSKPTLPLSIAFMLTMLLVISVREGALLLCDALGYSSAANIVGMIILFTLLALCRLTVGLPTWISQASNTLLVESGFAFLPISAGAGLLLFTLGGSFWGIIITIIVSTLIPMWGLAKLADYWLGRHDTLTKNHDPISRADTQEPRL